MQDRHERGEGPPPRKTLKEKVDRKELGRKTGRGFYSYDK
jgi:3-hydroxyacyl-CoA dehydrogenase